MSLHPVHERPFKSVVEHGACFGLAIGLLMVAAVAIQWILHLVP
jgi:hypothetical protein